MATAQDIINDIKSDLLLNGSDYDAQILRAVQSTLRQLRGKRYWFLLDYETLTTTTSSETITLPTDFSAIESIDIVADGSRRTDGDGFDLLDFDNLREIWWREGTPQTGVPQAAAVLGNTLYLSHYAQGVYNVPLVYYKQDVTLPAATESSVWFDDGYDVALTMASYNFQRNSYGITANENAGDMVTLAFTNLDNTHLAKTVGR